MSRPSSTAWRIGGELPLEVDQDLADPGDRRDDRGAPAGLLGLQRGIAELFGVELQRGLHRRRLVAKIVAGLHERIGHRAVDHAGIQVAIAVMMGETLAERPLPEAAGPSMAMIMKTRPLANASSE